MSPKIKFASIRRRKISRAIFFRSSKMLVGQPPKHQAQCPARASPLICAAMPKPSPPPTGFWNASPLRSRPLQLLLLRRRKKPWTRRNWPPLPNPRHQPQPPPLPTPNKLPSCPKPTKSSPRYWAARRINDSRFLIRVSSLFRISSFEFRISPRLTHATPAGHHIAHVESRFPLPSFHRYSRPVAWGRHCPSNPHQRRRHR